jgi:hypothetical protein
MKLLWLYLTENNWLSIISIWPIFISLNYNTESLANIFINIWVQLNWEILKMPSPTYSFNDLIKIELFCGENKFFFVFDHKSPFILLELKILIMWPLNSFDHYSLIQIVLPIVTHFIKKLPKSSFYVSNKKSITLTIVLWLCLIWPWI